ncbi:MAG TPA: hypothetical protein VKZ52_02420 [Burkholderiaceae bacterium]|nr:hypothetical protein [Burkholderiaceae bacterium]
MTTNIKDNFATIEILGRAAEVLELTYYHWQLHEQTAPASQGKRKAATRRVSARALPFGVNRCGAFA